MLIYLLTRLSALRAAARGDRGSIALEWIAIGAIVFLAALWAGAKIVAAIHRHGGSIF